MPLHWGATLEEALLGFFVCFLFCLCSPPTKTLLHFCVCFGKDKSKAAAKSFCKVFWYYLWVARRGRIRNIL